MLHPFEPAGSEPATALGADPNAAEADIMRFIAILALCLMLLFSVDQSFNRAPAPAAPPLHTNAPATPDAVTPVVAPSVTAPPVIDSPVALAEPAMPPLVLSDSDEPSSPAVVTEPQPLPAVPETPAATSLYFASDVVLLTLLAQRRIEVYVAGDAGWSSVTLAGATPVDPPEKTLYRLRPETVPALLRRTVPTGASEAAPDWAVWLEPPIAQAIDALAPGANSDDLVIERNGNVRSQPRSDSPATPD